MRRAVAVVAWLGLAHTVWVNAASPCPMTTHHAPEIAATVAASPEAGASHGAPSHSGSAHASPAHATSAHATRSHDAAPSPGAPASDEPSAPENACPMAMACAPMLVAIPPTIPAVATAPVSMVPSASSMWREGIARALEPPPPRSV